MSGAGALFVFALVICVVMELSLGPYFRRKKLRRALMDGFGKLPQETGAEDIEDIACYFKAKCEAHPAPRAVDNTTWSDLDMDQVFLSMNAVQSDVGEHVLYAMLREIDVTEPTLLRRRELIDWFGRDEPARTQLLMLLNRVGKRRYHGVTDYLFHPELKRPDHFFWYVTLAIAPFLVLIAAIFQPALLLVYALFFLINMLVYYRTGRTWQSEVRAVEKLSRVVRCVKGLAKLKLEPIEPELSELRELERQLRPLMRWASLFALQRQGPLDFITDYVRIMLQLDMISLCRISKVLSKSGEALERAYAAVGEMDALIAIASLHKRRSAGLCVPEFHQAHDVQAEELAHPLLAQPVTNSIDWRRDVLITGSNASGKSTFTKAIAINAILAQSVCVAFAKRFVMPRARVMSSMAIRDDVTRGESYFIAEIKSLRRILDALSPEMITLCFIDEILRGTNTVERIAASSALLRYMAGQNVLVMAATHDIELTELLKESYENRHFREELTPDGMIFPYKLMDGPSATRNAILLLGQMGFPDEVTAAARLGAERFDRERKWA